jgi:hypothetical protein
MRFSLATVCRGFPTILTAAILASFAGAQEQSGPAFKPGALLSAGNTNYIMSVSSDKKSGAVIIDELENQLNGIGSPLFATRVFSISMPLAGAEKGVKLGVFLEGHVFRLKGTDISLITTVNGQTHVMDFAKFSSASGGPASEECTKFEPGQDLPAVKRRVGAKYSAAPKRPDIASKPGLNAPPEENDSDFVQCILLDVPSASDLRVNAVLALHRHNADTAGYLNVTTITASVRSEDKATK